VLARTSSNFKRQTSPLVRGGRPTSTNSQLSDSNKNLVLGLTPREAGRLNVGRNMTLTLSLTLLCELVGELDNRWGSVVVSCCCQKLLTETGESSGTQRKGNVRRCKPLPSNGNEDVTVETSV
jgi:hypothetical protein